MFDRILVPTDGSKFIGNVLDCAIDLAKKYDAELHGLFVIDVMPQDWDPPTVESVRDLAEQEGERATSVVEERGDSAGIETKVAIRTHPQAHEEILEYVDDYNMDLIVMGTRGRTGLDRLLLGSTAERVVRKSAVPVMTVSTRPNENREEDPA